MKDISESKLLEILGAYAARNAMLVEIGTKLEVRNKELEDYIISVNARVANLEGKLAEQESENDDESDIEESVGSKEADLSNSPSSG